MLVSLLVLVSTVGQAANTQPIGVQWIQQINGSAIRLKADGWEAGLRSQAREPDRLWLQPGVQSQDASDLTLAGDFSWRDDALSVISRFEYQSLAPRPAFNHRKRQDASIQTSVQRRFGDTRVAVDWQHFGEDYALPTDIWFAGDRQRRAFRVERSWAGGQISAGVADQTRHHSKPHRLQIRRRWLGWHGMRPSGRTLRVEFERLDRRPTGPKGGYDEQSDTRLRLGFGHQLGRLLVNLNTEWFRQQTLRDNTRALTHAGIVNLSAQVRFRLMRIRAWTTASNFDLDAGHNAVLHAGFQAIADTAWPNVYLEIGLDRAYRDDARVSAPVLQSKARGKIRWTPSQPLTDVAPQAKASLELVADLRERRSGGSAEMADPTLMLIWTVR